MDRSTRRLFVGALLGLAIVMVVVVVLAGSSSGPDPSLPRQRAIGVIVAVDAEGLTDVSGFTLRQEGGALLEFAIALENGAEFPLAHLAEHQATAAPVVVTYVDDERVLTAVRVEDWVGQP